MRADQKISPPASGTTTFATVTALRCWAAFAGARLVALFGKYGVIGSRCISWCGVAKAQEAGKKRNPDPLHVVDRFVVLRKPSRLLTPRMVGIYLISLVSLWPVHLHAQGTDRCTDLEYGARRLMENWTVTTTENLEAALVSLREARLCYAADARTANIAYLLRNEIWSLTELGRLDDAVESVRLFETQYFDVTSTEQQARFLMDKHRLYRLRNDPHEAMRAFLHGVLPAETLPPPLKAHQILNGASTLLETQFIDDAEGFIADAMTITEGLGNSRPEQYAYARSLAVRAEMELERYGRDDEANLSVAEEQFARALEIYEQQDRHSRAGTVIALQGRLAVARGDTSGGIKTLTRAIAYAEAFAKYRALLYALYKRGETHLEARNFQTAERDLRRASLLADSTGILEFQPHVLTGLGLALLEQGQLTEAERVFQEAISSTGETQYLALIRADAQSGLTTIAERRLKNERLWWIVAAVLALIIGISLQPLWQRFKARRRRRRLRLGLSQN